MRNPNNQATTAGLIIFLLICLIAFPNANADDKNQASTQEIIETKSQASSVNEKNLMGKWWPDGSVTDLQKLDAKDVEKIQIFNLIWLKRMIDIQRKNELAEKKYTTYPLTRVKDIHEIEGLLTLLRKAPRYNPTSNEVHCESPPPDRVLVVQPVHGEPFEILYSSYFHEPFGEVHSLELKEALYALSGGCTGISIIHFENGEVHQTINRSAIAPHRGGSYSQTTAVEMHLTAETGLTLFVRIRNVKSVLMEDEKSLHYGQAKVFASQGPGSYIVLLHKP